MPHTKPDKIADVPLAQQKLTPQELQEIREQVKRQLQDRQLANLSPAVAVSYSR